jgi:hypothetical protein
MTQFWCPECEVCRGNYVDENGELRGIECDHRLDATRVEVPA